MQKNTAAVVAVAEGEMKARKRLRGSKTKEQKRKAWRKRRVGRRMDSGGGADARWRSSGGEEDVDEVQNKTRCGWRLNRSAAK